jgi:hypothetical protein
MGRKAAQGMDAGTDLDVISKQAHLPGTVDQPAAQRTFGLKAADHPPLRAWTDCSSDDAAPVLHRTCRWPRDDRAALDAVELDGVLHIADEVKRLDSLSLLTLPSNCRASPSNTLKCRSVISVAATAIGESTNISTGGRRCCWISCRK